MIKQLYKGKLLSTTIGQQQAKPKVQEEASLENKDAAEGETSTQKDSQVPAEEKKTIKVFKPKPGRG